jgi:hypothetical protein
VPASKITLVSANLSTPCYSVGFVDRLNISNSDGSCNMNAFNGQSLDSSTNAYKIYANKSQVSTASAFSTLAKAAIEKDVHSTLPTFTIDREQITTFAGSPAYAVYTSDPAHNIVLVEAAVLHKVASGPNIFVLVHAANGNNIDLSLLESQWQWK